MPDVVHTITEDWKPKIKFVVQDHSRVMDTVTDLIGAEEACNFCQAAPIVIVYRGWDDKVVTACEAHKEIVLEMIERGK
jgi:hypothetical protein